MVWLLCLGSMRMNELRFRSAALTVRLGFKVARGWVHNAVVSLPDCGVFIWALVADRGDAERHDVDASALGNKLGAVRKDVASDGTFDPVISWFANLVEWLSDEVIWCGNIFFDYWSDRERRDFLPLKQFFKMRLVQLVAGTALAFFSLTEGWVGFSKTESLPVLLRGRCLCSEVKHDSLGLRDLHAEVVFFEWLLRHGHDLLDGFSDDFLANKSLGLLPSLGDGNELFFDDDLFGAVANIDFFLRGSGAVLLAHYRL